MDNKNNEQKQLEHKEHKLKTEEIAVRSAKKAGNERARREIISDYESECEVEVSMLWIETHLSTRYLRNMENMALPEPN